MSKGGRPSKYTPKLANEICKRIAQGDTVRSICHDEDMPSAASIYSWLLDDDKKEFLEQYEKAKNIQAELMFEELLEIADDGSNDWLEKQGKDGSIYEVVNSEVVQRSRLRVDTRKWYLSKVLPKKFGDKIDLTTNGKDLPTPIYGGRSVQNKGHDSDEEDI
jgi:hypothetical protein